MFLILYSSTCAQATEEEFSTISSPTSCANSYVHITATDRCLNQVNSTVPVKIDTTPPQVSCTFYGKQRANITTSILAKQMYDVQFDYSASDTCLGPLDVKVEIFSSEREGQFSGPVLYRHKMAYFYNSSDIPNHEARLILQKNICPAPTNGQCVKDPKVPDARLYTAKITATDQSGLTASSECTLTILPVDLTGKNVDTTKSTIRHKIAEYASIFQ